MTAVASRTGADEPAIPLGETEGLAAAATRSVFWSAGQKWGSEALETVLFMVLARLVMPEAFGVVTMARVAISLAQLFLDQGLESAIVQRKDLRRAHVDTALWVNVALGAVLTAAGVAAAGPLARAMLGEDGGTDAAELAGILRLLSASFVFAGASGIPNALLRRRLDFRDLALRNWIATIVGGVVGISLALGGFGAWSLAWMQVVGVAAGVPVLWLRCGHVPGFRVRLYALRDLLGFGASIFGYRLVGAVGAQMDRFVVGRVIGAAPLGYYALAQRVVMSLSRVFGQTLGYVILPVFSRVQDDRERFSRSYLQTVQLLSIVSAPAYLGACAVARDLVVVLFGERWTPAVPVLRILLAVGFLQTIVLVNALVLMAAGRPRKLLAVNVAATAVKTVALLVFGSRGIEVVAWTYLVEIAIMLPAQLLLLREAAGVAPASVVAAAGRPVAAGLVMTAAVVVSGTLLGASPPPARLAFLVPLGAAVYVLVLLAADRAGLRRLHELARAFLSRRTPARAP